MNQFPKWKYSASKPPVIVDDEEAEKKLGKGWADNPGAFLYKEHPEFVDVKVS